MSFITELKRRNVFKVAVMYAAVSWVLIQLADTLTPALLLPEWTVRLVAILLLIGFPLAVIFAWAFELTEEGLKPTKLVDKDSSLTQTTGKKLEHVIIGFLAVAVILLVVDRLFLNDAAAPEDSIEASIAVLPFADMSPEGDQEYFSDGISEELLNLLANIPEMQVAGRTSSFAFKDQNQDLREIGEILGVAHVLEGSVRKQGMRVRITAQLIDAATGNHMWSDTYDRDMNDIFAVQDEIASAITEQLRVEILGEEIAVIPRNIVSVDAHNYYLMGLQRLNEFEYIPLQQASNYFKRAYEDSPGYMDAYWGYGRSIIYLESYGVVDRDAALEEMKALLELIRSHETIASANTLVLESNLLHLDNRHSEELPIMRRAYEMDPENAVVAGEYANALTNTGHYEEALEVISLATAVDPLSLVLQRDKAINESFLGQIDQATRTLNRILDFDPNFAQAYYDLGNLQFSQGDFSASMESQIRGAERDPDDPDGPAWTASDLMMFGYTNLALDYLNRADALSENEVFTIALRASHQALSGDYEQAYLTATDLLRSGRPSRHNSINMAFDIALYATQMNGSYQRLVDFHEELVPSLSAETIDLASDIEGEPHPRRRTLTAITYAWSLSKVGNESRALAVAEAIFEVLGDDQENTNPLILSPAFALLGR